jgi:hypothetical protein
MPVYTRIPRDPDMALHWFARPDVAHLVQFERFAATA